MAKRMSIKLKKHPTYIHSDGRVELKCTVDGKSHPIVMSIREFGDLWGDMMRAYLHYRVRKETSKK